MASERVWQREATPAQLNERCAGTMHDVIGLVFTEVGADAIVARLPVDHRTKQPYGILHGGANAVLAEALGSVASGLAAPEGSECLGIELNINHLRAVSDGCVTGRVTPIHIGGTLHVWAIEIHDDAGRRTAVARLTVLVRERRVRPT